MKVFINIIRRIDKAYPREKRHGRHCTCASTTASNVNISCAYGGQAYSRRSITHGHITDCKLDSVVYAGVDVMV